MLQSCFHSPIAASLVLAALSLFQTCNLPSLAQVASSEPSGENSMAWTQSRWPSSSADWGKGAAMSFRLKRRIT